MWESIEAYYPHRIIYILFILGLWFIPYYSDMPWYWQYIPLLLAFIPIAYEGIVQLIEGSISSEFFLIIATGIALAGGEEAAIFVVLLIMLVAQYIDTLIKRRTDEALTGLVSLIPSDVLVKRGNEEVLVPLEEVLPGMLVIIKTGGRIPVDGTIVVGQASVHEAVLTGESVPLEKGKGELVFAGTYIDAGSITIEVEMIGKETLFGKIKILLDQAGKRKAPVVSLADRITKIFTPLFLVFIGTVWFFTGNTKMVITLLIFGSPLELTLVTPLTMLAAILAAFRRGILVKGGESLQLLAGIDTMIFDKTGTLTMGSPDVISLESLHENYTKKDVLLLAAIAEKKSGHVLAKAIMDEAAKEHLEVPDPEKYVSLTGHGITITYNGVTYMLGNKHFMEAQEHGNHSLPPEPADREKFTTFYLATNTEVIGEICLADRIKPEARKTIDCLKRRGIESFVLLSGDKQSVAQSVAEKLGIAQAYGEIMPDKKLAMLKQLQESGHQVAMVGDGVNDAPALKQAQVGIAMGSMGMEPAIRAADIVLMSGNLDQIVFLYDLSLATMRTIKQNLIFGFALTHAVGITLALFSYLTPIQAALLHAVPDVLIMLNGARLINFGKKS